MNTLEVLSQIAKLHPEIDQFSLIPFPQQRLVQNWLKPWSEKEQKHFGDAIDMQKNLGLPFWNAIMLNAFSHKEYSSSLLKSALHHNSIDEVLVVDRKEIERGFSLDKVDSRRWAVNSKVFLKDGSVRHIPMIDFHIPVSDNNLNVVMDVCDVLGLTNGYLLISGVSYHYIGKQLLTEEELMLILINALFFCPIVDGAWISHQLREKSCSLRIDRKNGVETKVVKSFDFR